MDNKSSAQLIAGFLNNTHPPSKLKEMGIFKFGKLFFPSLFTDEFSLVHYKIILILFQLLDPRKEYAFERQRYILVHREAAKSTLCSKFIGLFLVYFKGYTILVRESMLNWNWKEHPDIESYMANYKNDRIVKIKIEENFIIILSESSNRAVRFVDFAKRKIEQSKDLAGMFGEKYPRIYEYEEANNRKHSGNMWRMNSFITSDNTVVMGKGAGNAIRGENEENRPTLIIVDDMYSIRNTQTEATRTKFRNWFFDEVVNSLDSRKGKILWIGTMVHPDIVVRDFRQDKTWQGVEIPLIEKDDLFDVVRECSSEGEFVLPTKSWAAMRQKKVRTLSWPERHTLYSILVRYNQALVKARLNGFYQEFMNEPVAPESMNIPPEAFVQTDIEFSEHHGHQIVEFKHDGYRWKGNAVLSAGVDPAASDSVTSDDTVIVVAGFARCYPIIEGMEVDAGRRALATGRIFPIIAHIEAGKYAIHEYGKMPGMCEALLNLDRRFVLENVKIEVNGQQEQIMREIEQAFSYGVINKDGVRTYKSGRSVVYGELSGMLKKGERILTTLLPIFQRYKVFICQKTRHINRLYDQLIMIPIADHDDLPDALAMAYKYTTLPQIYDSDGNIEQFEYEDETTGPSMLEIARQRFGSDYWYYL